MKLAHSMIIAIFLPASISYSNFLREGINYNYFFMGQ